MSGGRIDPTLLTTRGQNPNHTIYAAPRQAIYPRISAVPSTSLLCADPPASECSRPARPQGIPCAAAPRHSGPPRQTPVHPPCCGVQVAPTSFPNLLYYSTGGGNICQSTGQSRYSRLPGLPYFTGMWPVLSNACHSTVRAFRPYSLTTQTGKLSTLNHSAALSGILMILRKGKENRPMSRE